MRMMLLLAWLFTVCASLPGAAFDYNSQDAAPISSAFDLECFGAGRAEAGSHGVCHWNTEIAAVERFHIRKSNAAAFALLPDRKPSLNYSPGLPPPRS